MPQSAYLTINEKSAIDKCNLKVLEQQLTQYQSQTAKTGKQLAWGYGQAAFPYEVEKRNSADHNYLALVGTSPLYGTILMAISQKANAEQEKHCVVQITLPDNATHGDKAKANEFTRYLGKTWKAQTKMFNGRTMNFDLH